MVPFRSVSPSLLVLASAITIDSSLTQPQVWDLMTALEGPGGRGTGKASARGKLCDRLSVCLSVSVYLSIGLSVCLTVSDDTLHVSLPSHRP